MKQIPLFSPQATTTAPSDEGSPTLPPRPEEEPPELASSPALPRRPGDEATQQASSDDACTALLPRPLAKRISNTFSAMEIAEEEIEACAMRHPRQAERIRAAFKDLCPPAVLSEFGDDLYRAHARELIERVAMKTSLGPGTKAEVLAALSLGSLRAPLSRVESLLAYESFRTLFPGLAKVEFGPDWVWPLRPTGEDYVSIRELEATLRRRLGRARKMI